MGYTVMKTTNIIDFARRDGITDALTDLLRTGAQPLIATAVEAELAGYLVQFLTCALRQLTRLSCAMDINIYNRIISRGTIAKGPD